MTRSRYLGCLSLIIATTFPALAWAQDGQPKKESSLFARDNLVAWCIVPFDSKKRGPEERAQMLKKLGFKHFAYDWRAEHVPTFAAEIEALRRHGIQMDAFWFPAGLNADARAILDVLKQQKVKTQLWITMGDPGGKDQAAKVEAAVRILRPIAVEADKIGCTIGLYNHGGWFGEPENQIAILEQLKMKNAGIVYNQHHGHDHLERFPELLKKMKPHLLALNLNGMVKNGDRVGKKILPLGQGDLDLGLLKVIQESGYKGPIGILGHTNDDAEDRLRDNLDGLDWLTPQLSGQPAGPKPQPRTYKAPPAKEKAKSSATLPYSKELVDRLVLDAREKGDPRHGAVVFRSPQFACISCHKIGSQGGLIGPDLSKVGICLTPDQIVESVLWPKRHIKDEYKAISVTLNDGKTHQGYKVSETDTELVLRDPATGKPFTLRKAHIEERADIGTLMPDGLDAAMTSEQRRHLFRFLMDLGRTKGLTDHSHTAAAFPFDRAPLQPKDWPHWKAHVNRERVYDFYARQADYFRKEPTVPLLLAQFPGLDGGKHGHWGNQNDKTWADGRWNDADLGSLQCGVFRGAGVTVPRGVCVRLGDNNELSTCFNPDTLCYEALWEGGFVKFSPFRHGFLDGLQMHGNALPRPSGAKPGQPFTYHGFYRHGRRIVFSYTVGGVALLDAPWVENGKFTRILAPADKHPLAKLTRGGPAQWPKAIETTGSLGKGSPYAVDTIQPPFDNPWKAPLFFGDHDFLPDGSALLCTMQGDVWRVSGLDDKLDRVTWRRFASGLHQALGLVISEGKIYVLGRDQITCLHDRNGDGEADFYECFSNAYDTSVGGHDYVCGLQRDSDGRFYTASSKQGLLRISSDGKKATVLATGFRNPDGLGLDADGAVTVPCSEGDWTPASMICLVRPDRMPSKTLIGGHQPPYFGYGGPRGNTPPDLPLVYLPRGIDNSAGAQTLISSNRWGPLQGRMLHLSYGTGAHFLLLRDEVDGQPQGAVIPLPGEFLSGAHRGRFNPKDGQLYVTGMAGWGTYAVDDGCFQRVRYTGADVQLPSAFHVHENGILLTFTRPLKRAVAADPKAHFAQAWNYRYSGAYGSQEFSSRHPGTIGHDPLAITSAHVLGDGHKLFLEIPDLQPVNQLHLRLNVDDGAAQELFLTVHRLDVPFTALPGYKANARTIAAHPILADLRASAKPIPNPWRQPLPNATALSIQADKNLTFAQKTLTVKAGQVVKLTFANPDVVPHNWVLVKPGSLERVGTLVNALIADPDAASRQYVPKAEDVLCYTDIVSPQREAAIYFRAPSAKGRYPYLCTFPGHWMVMNGQLIVE